MATHVDWGRLPRDEFERIVNVLITRDGEERGYAALAPSGRGGDDGIDIELRDQASGQIVQIYQLKHFPEGFSSGWSKSRRPQIRKSFQTAMKHDPDHWTLVVPEQFTAPEQKFVTGLAKDVAVIPHIMGTVELDRLLTQYPDVQDWAARDAVQDVLSRLGTKETQPVTTEDAAAGLARYIAQQDTFSLYWGRRPAVIDGEMAWEFYAKRQDAEVMEPLRITMNTSFGSEDNELQKLAADVFGYGRGVRLDLPERVVQSLIFDGPSDWFAGVEHDVAVSIVPAYNTSESRPTRIEAYSSDGTLLAALNGRTVNSNAGDAGGFVEAQFEGSLTMLWRFPRDSRTGSTDITLDAVGQSSAAVARVARFLWQFRQASKLRLDVDGHSAVAEIYEGETVFIDDELLEYAEDLGAIERLADVTLPFPEVMPGLDDRIWTRITRMILEGKCALIHKYQSLNATLNGTRDKGMDRLLSDGAQILNANLEGGNDESGIRILGINVRVEGMSIWHPQMRIADAEAVRARLDEGTAEGTKVILEPVDGTPFRIYSSYHMKSGDAVLPAPWNISGVSEHSALEGIQSAVARSTN